MAIWSNPHPGISRTCAGLASTGSAASRGRMWRARASVTAGCSSADRRCGSGWGGQGRGRGAGGLWLAGWGYLRCVGGHSHGCAAGCALQQLHPPPAPRRPWPACRTNGWLSGRAALSIASRLGLHVHQPRLGQVCQPGDGAERSPPGQPPVCSTGRPGPPRCRRRPELLQSAAGRAAWGTPARSERGRARGSAVGQDSSWSSALDLSAPAVPEPHARPQVAPSS